MRPRFCFSPSTTIVYRSCAVWRSLGSTLSGCSSRDSLLNAFRTSWTPAPDSRPSTSYGSNPGGSCSAEARGDASNARAANASHVSMASARESPVQRGRSGPRALRQGQGSRAALLPPPSAPWSLTRASPVARTATAAELASTGRQSRGPLPRPRWRRRPLTWPNIARQEAWTRRRERRCWLRRLARPCLRPESRTGSCGPRRRPLTRCEWFARDWPHRAAPKRGAARAEGGRPMRALRRLWRGGDDSRRVQAAGLVRRAVSSAAAVAGARRPFPARWRRLMTTSAR